VLRRFLHSTGQKLLHYLLMTDLRELDILRQSWLLGGRMQFEQLDRREFITLLGGSAAAWPLAAWAQQPERMRRIGVLTTMAADDPVFQDRVGAFLQGLERSGWTVGRNVRIEARWTMSIASSRARSRATCRFRIPPRMNWWSISRPPRRSASISRRRCSPAPTR
jgi:hypothetical protein